MPDLNYDALSEAIRRMESARDARQGRPRDDMGRFVSAPTYFPACGVSDCTTCAQVDASGYDRDGYNRNGLDSAGYDRAGYDRDGYNREGYTARGYNREGYNREGFTRYGYDRDGRDRDGYDQFGYDDDGYSRSGFNRHGEHRNGSFYDDNGRDRMGFDEDGYDQWGFDSSGFDSDGYDADGYDRDGCDRDGDRRSCGCGYRDCEECYPDSHRLHNYSYTPILKFRGDAGPYYGLELEVTTDQIGALCDIVEEQAGSLVYCKEDGSVAGAELVTHPMSYDWAMEHFPWQMLPELRKRADADIVSSDNGIHVHVSRDGFTNPAHTYRWMKFWYRNPSDMQRIGRRRADNWGGFRPDHRTGQFEHVKRDKPGYRRSNDGTVRAGRYAAINTTNDATLEVRIFASTLRPQRAQAALQLVAATVEYTRGLSADAITHRRGWDWAAFMAWTRKSGKYGALVAEDHIRRYL